MSLKMKLTSTIVAFFLVFGLVIMGVMAAPSATVNLGGTITFKATNVYAKVTGKISGTNAETQPTLDDITIDDKTIDGDITTWSSQDLAFKDDGSAITIEVTIENLATDRKLYAYITDTKQNVANVNKTMKQGEEDYADTELITLDSTTTKTTITLSMEIDDKNQSLEAGALYGYNIVLMDISGIPELSEDMTYQTLKFRTINGQSGLSVEDIGGSYPDYDYKSTGDLVIPAYVNNGGTIYPVTKIDGYAFGDCDIGEGSTINSVIIPNTVTSIGTDAFAECHSLTSVTIPNSVTSIGVETFIGCNSLESVFIGNSVASIGGAAFSSCSSLTSVTIPNSVTSIGYGAFRGCDSLTSITIPSSVTSIEGAAFSACGRLTSIVVESGNGVYDSRNNCNAIIETATNTLITGCKNTIIPNTVESIGDSAFRDCDSLTSITIPSSVTSIGGHAFSASGLTSITIPDSVTSIGFGAFSFCSSLTSVTIGNAVTSIKGSAFEECENLTDVYYRGTEEEWSNIQGLADAEIPSGATIHYEYTGK